MQPIIENSLQEETLSVNNVLVHGQPMAELPKDLYIPPDALEVFLEAFSGPLDLLLYLIKKENIDILDIPIAQITEQYMQYVDLMKNLHLELAGEYLVMAAMLAEIKSRMLLPKPAYEEDEDDPRAELVRRLREYERYKKAAEDLNNLPRVERDIFVASVDKPEIKRERQIPKIELQDLFAVFKDILHRASMYLHHQVKREGISVRERMSQILLNLQTTKFVNFEKMFNVCEGRHGVVVTFMAILELIRQSIIEIVQAEPFGQIYLKSIDSVQV